jgi:hypothetical protein
MIASTKSPFQENYLLRHWRGKHSLTRSLWMNAILGNVLLSEMIFFGAAGWVIKFDRHIAIDYPFEIGFGAVLLAGAVWGLVGVWRSCGVLLRQGKKGLPWLARIFCIVISTAIFIFYDTAINDFVDAWIYNTDKFIPLISRLASAAALFSPTHAAMPLPGAL